ncbi:protein containing fasciclin domain [Bacteroidales bacterium 6E]|nr:protein containing fasciclin domain [Bacteroidales bacterium 6E]
MIRSRLITFLALGFLTFYGCQDDMQVEKFKRPDWLAGKIYTQLKEQPELSTFAKCLELTQFDKILDASGSYTIFAPTDEAFAAWFQSHSKYKKVEDIPLPELDRIVKYHIVQNPWSKNQLRSLDVFGWIDPKDLTNNEPRGYKRETLLLDKNRKYGIKGEFRNFRNYISIVDTLSSPWIRNEATDSRKYAPIFFKEYFDIYELSSSDYEFYFNRPIESPADIYYVGAKVIGDEVFAENGFVYKIDRVVEPLKNAYQIMASKEGPNSYKDFLDFINSFPEFVYDDRKTMLQPGASEGLAVDSLFDLSYPNLTFNINRERTKAPAGTYGLPENVSIRYHHGLIAPTDAAFNAFVNEYLVGGTRWGSLRNAPDHIKRIIVNTYMSINPIYPTDLSKGYYNGELDIVKLDQSEIVQKEYGSNTTFIGVKNAIIPRAFKSVTGPIYLQRGYSRVMNAIELAGLLPALKRQGQNYMLFVESDQSLRLDSSLVYDEARNRFSAFMITPGSYQEFGMTQSDLRNLLMNHIGLDHAKGLARKEFIPNMAGNYLIVDNVTGEVRGTDFTTKGYGGSQIVQEIPKPISNNADNGTTYEINNWFSFSSTDLYTRISTNYTRFHNIMRSAGLVLEKEFRYSFMSQSEIYTVFAPSDQALEGFDTSGMTQDDLKRFVMMHFVPGHIIFTDGKKAAGYYGTSRISETSSQYSSTFTQIRIRPGIDVIEFIDKNGDVFATVNESARSNIIVSRNIGVGTETIKNILAYGVIHELDKPLLFNQLDTK